MKHIICLLALCLSSGAQAEWQALASAEDGAWYSEAPVTQPNRTVRVWTLFDHNNPVGAFGVLSVKTLHEFDCAQGRMRDVNIVVFNDHMARGSILRNTYPGTQLIHPPPGSVFERMMGDICKP